MLAALARPDDAPRRPARPLAQPRRDRAAARRGRAGDPVDRPDLRDRAQRPHAHLRDRRRAAIGVEPGRRAEGVGSQRDLRRRAVRHRARAAARRAVRPRAADGLPRAAGRRPRGRRDRLGRARRRRRALRRRAGRARRSSPAAALPLGPTTSTRRTGPPPLFLASGFTDDLFPVDEALRFANRTRATVTRGCRCRCCSATSATSAPPTSPAERAPPAARDPAPGSTTTCAAAGRAPRSGVTAYAADLPAHGALAQAVARALASAASRAGRCGPASALAQTIALDRRRPAVGGGDRPGRRRRRRLRHDAVGGGARDRRLHAAGRPRPRLRRCSGAPTLIAGLRVSGADSERRPGRGPALGRRPRRHGQTLVARGLLPAAAGSQRLAAPPRRLALRPRARRQARAARHRLALRPALERRLRDRGGAPAAAPARAPSAGLPEGAPDRRSPDPGRRASRAGGPRPR